MKKNALLIANSGFTIVNFRSELIKELKVNYDEVYVICPANCNLIESQDLTASLDSLGAQFVPLSISRSGLNPIKELKLLFNLYREIKNISPSLVLNYTIKPTIYGSIAAKLNKVSKIASNITGVGYVFATNSLKSILISKLVRMQYKLALKCNDVVFFQNKDDLSFFINQKLVKETKCEIVNGSGVDTRFFTREVPISRDLNFLFVGRLLKDKGIFEYVEASKKLKKLYPSARFGILGPLDINPQSLTKTEVSQLKKEQGAEYLGTSNNVREYLEEFNVLVLPSYREGTPRSVLEGMSMSMAIITTDAPGCRETVINNKNGLLVEPKSTNSLICAMKRLLDNPDLIEEYGRSSRYIACKKYDVNSVNRSILYKLGVSSDNIGL